MAMMTINYVYKSSPHAIDDHYENDDNNDDDDDDEIGKQATIKQTSSVFSRCTEYVHFICISCTQQYNLQTQYTLYRHIILVS